jgi:hypothetical protein
MNTGRKRNQIKGYQKKGHIPPDVAEDLKRMASQTWNAMRSAYEKDPLMKFEGPGRTSLFDPIMPNLNDHQKATIHTDSSMTECLIELRKLFDKKGNFISPTPFKIFRDYIDYFDNKLQRLSICAFIENNQLIHYMTFDDHNSYCIKITSQLSWTKDELFESSIRAKIGTRIRMSDHFKKQWTNDFCRCEGTITPISYTICQMTTEIDDD